MRGIRLTREFIETEFDGRIDGQINNFLLEGSRRLIDVKYAIAPVTEFTDGHSQALLIYEEGH